MDGLANVAEDEMKWLGRVGFLNEPGGPGIVLDCMSRAIVIVFFGGKGSLTTALQCFVADVNTITMRQIVCTCQLKVTHENQSWIQAFMTRAFERNIVELQEAFLCNGQAQTGFSLFFRVLLLYFREPFQGIDMS